MWNYVAKFWEITFCYFFSHNVSHFILFAYRGYFWAPRVCYLPILGSMWRIVVMKEWNFVAQKLSFFDNVEITKHLSISSTSSYNSQNTVYNSTHCSDHGNIYHIYLICEKLWLSVQASGKSSRWKYVSHFLSQRLESLIFYT